MLENFDIEKTEKGTFIYKSKNQLIMPKVKKQYKDPHHYPVLEKVEQEFKQNSRQMIERIGIETLKFLNTR